MSTLAVRPRPPRLRWIASVASTRPCVGSGPSAPVRIEAFVIECDGFSRLYVRGRLDSPDQTRLDVGVRFADGGRGGSREALADLSTMVVRGRFAIEPIPLPSDAKEGIYFITVRQASALAHQEWSLTAELTVGPCDPTGRELREALAS